MLSSILILTTVLMWFFLGYITGPTLSQKMVVYQKQISHMDLKHLSADESLSLAKMIPDAAATALFMFPMMMLYNRR